eukprot:g16412.t1
MIKEKCFQTFMHFQSEHLLVSKTFLGNGAGRTNQRCQIHITPNLLRGCDKKEDVVRRLLCLRQTQASSTSLQLF